MKLCMLNSARPASSNAKTSGIVFGQLPVVWGCFSLLSGKVKDCALGDTHKTDEQKRSQNWIFLSQMDENENMH